MIKEIVFNLDRADGRRRLIRFGERAHACSRIYISAALQGSLHSLTLPPPARVPGFSILLCFGVLRLPASNPFRVVGELR
jgi:hypothetical protein